MRGRLAFFVTVIQLILFAGHASLYETIVYFWPVQSDSALLDLRVALAILSVTFVTASLLAFRYFNVAVRIYYTLAAAWLGIFSFLFFASCALWVAYGAASIVGLHPNRQEWAIVFLSAALLISAYGIINAAVIRVKAHHGEARESSRGVAWPDRDAGERCSSRARPEPGFHPQARGKSRTAQERHRFHHGRFVRWDCRGLQRSCGAVVHALRAARAIFRAGQS